VRLFVDEIVKSTTRLDARHAPENSNADR